MFAVKRRLPAFACLAALIIHSAMALARWQQSESANQRTRLNALVELAGEPLAAHQKTSRADTALKDRISLSSTEAQAYRSQLAGEHDAFKAAAATVAPSLRINTECHTLLNAVSVEATPE